jgi:hypothetical protein
MRKSVLAVTLFTLTLTALPGMGMAQGVGTWKCDPNGPSGAFAAGIPAADNPAWCATGRSGFGMATEQEALPGQTRHGRRLRHRN